MLTDILTKHCTLKKHMHCMGLASSALAWDADRWSYFVAVKLNEPRQEKVTLDHTTHDTLLLTIATESGVLNAMKAQ